MSRAHREPEMAPGAARTYVTTMYAPAPRALVAASPDAGPRVSRGRPRAWLFRRVVLAAMCLAAAALSACESCQTAPTTGYEGMNDDIAEELSRVGVGPGDVFEVSVYGEEQLTRTLRVSSEGTIHYPFIGLLQVDGLTVTEIEALIRERLMDGFLRDPSVTVFVQEYNSKKIFVLGEVDRPGTFAYTSQMNIVEAISLAGGFTASANTNYVVVTRRTPEGDRRIPIPVEKITQGLASNFQLQPGDIVFVPDRLL